MTNEEATRYAEGLVKNGGNVQRQEFVKVVIEALKRISEIDNGIESLKDDLKEAYKLNDAILSYVLKGNAITEYESWAESFSHRVMQDLQWLIDTIDREVE